MITTSSPLSLWSTALPSLARNAVCRFTDENQNEVLCQNPHIGRQCGIPSVLCVASQKFRAATSLSSAQDHSSNGPGAVNPKMKAGSVLGTDAVSPIPVVVTDVSPPLVVISRPM